MDDCPACRYFDILIRMKPGPRVVQVIADHMRAEHEPPG